MQNKRATIILTVVLIVIVVILAYFAFKKQEVVPGLSEQGHETSNWKEIAFPPLTFKYIRLAEVETKPRMRTLDEPYECTVGKNEMGETTQTVIAGKTYCVEIQADGAAGTTYKTYTYTTGMTQINFALAFPTCQNYDDPKMTECLNERATFSADKIIENAHI